MLFEQLHIQGFVSWDVMQKFMSRGPFDKSLLQTSKEGVLHSEKVKDVCVLTNHGFATMFGFYATRTIFASVPKCHLVGCNSQ